MSDDNIFKKAAYTSIGLMLLGVKKAENLVKDFGDKANLPESEVKLYLDKLSAEADSARENFNKAMREEVSKYLQKLNLPSREEVDALQKQVIILQKELDQIKQKERKPHAPE